MVETAGQSTEWRPARVDTRCGTCLGMRGAGVYPLGNLFRACPIVIKRHLLVRAIETG